MKLFIKDVISLINKKYSREILKYQLEDNYFNMRTKVEPVFHIVEQAKQAMIEVGITPDVKPIRGGTDGARLSYMGLPCPNIFTGGHNFHGRYEYVAVESMQLATDVIVNVVTITAERSNSK